MPNMLTSEDLKAIGQVVEDKIEDALIVVNKGFSDIEERFGKKFDGIDKRFDGIETRLTNIETNMATKDFVERRLAKTDGKINALVNVMEKKHVIAEDEERAIFL